MLYIEYIYIRVSRLLLILIRHLTSAIVPASTDDLRYKVLTVLLATSTVQYPLLYGTLFLPVTGFLPSPCLPCAVPLPRFGYLDGTFNLMTAVLYWGSCNFYIYMYSSNFDIFILPSIFILRVLVSGISTFSRWHLSKLASGNRRLVRLILTCNSR